MKIGRSTQHLLAASVAVSALVLTGCGTADEPDVRLSADDPASEPASEPASDQEVSPGEPADALGEANLLSDDEAVYPNGGSDWRARSTVPGDGQAAFNPCARSSLAGLGATSVLLREFEFVVSGTGDVEPSLTFNEIVGEFGSGADAEAAYAEIRGWLDDCLPQGADDYRAGGFSPVPIPVDGEAEAQLSTYRPVDAGLDPHGDEGWFLETGLILSGDRVAVLSQLTHGQDYNWPEGTPVELMLPAAASRLVGDTAASDPPSSEPTPAIVTTIPDGIPLDAEMADMSGDGGEYRTPYHPGPSEEGVTVDLCGQDVWPLDDGVDRLWAWADGPEYGDRRELVTLPTVDAAVQVIAAIRDGLQDCDSQGNEVWTVSDVDTGYDSVTFSRTYAEGLGLDAFQVTRVGSAALLTVVSGEGALGDIGSVVPHRTELTQVLAGHLCSFTAAGC